MDIRSTVMAGPPDVRHSRQAISHIGRRSLDQPAIESGRVASVGAGVLGSTAVMAAAPCGISVDVFDRDVITVDTLGKSIAFRPSDLGQPKALALARRARQLDSALRTRGFVEDALYTVGGGTWERYDVVWLNTDNLRSRVELASLALRLPDGPRTVIEAGLNGFDWSVQVMGPHCIACALDEEAPLDLAQSCNGITVDVDGAIMPTTLPAALSASGVMVQETLLALSGQEPVFRGREARADMAAARPLCVYEVGPRPSCRLHRRLRESEVVRLPMQRAARVGEIRTSVARALELKPDDVALAAPREILTTARCLDCGCSYSPRAYSARFIATICRTCGRICRNNRACDCGESAPPVPSWPRLRLECPSCGLLDPNRFDLNFESLLNDDSMTLAEAGLPRLEIIRAIAGELERTILPALTQRGW
jgi:molybdopterin/thiamine biosynthesis adenylyltransferase